MIETFFLNHLDSWKWLIYSLIFLSLLFEGEVVLFTAFYLMHLRYLSFGYTSIIAISAIFLGDILWYRFGHYLERTIPFAHRWLSKVTSPIDNSLAKRPLITLFVSKFTYGFYRPTLMRCGVLKVPFSRFIKIDILASICWIVLIGTLAYTTSFSMIYFKRYFKYLEIGLLIWLIFIFLFNYIISRIVKKSVIKNSLNRSNNESKI